MTGQKLQDRKRRCRSIPHKELTDKALDLFQIIGKQRVGCALEYFLRIDVELTVQVFEDSEHVFRVPAPNHLELMQ